MKNVEDVYAASPLQQGLIFHGLYAPESSAYTVQMVCDLEGRLDAGAFREAWRRVFARYSVLRTCFVWEDIGEVLQVVRREVELPWREWDWRAMSAAEQEERLETLVRQDRAQGFEFSKAPLVRISLVRLAEGRAKFVWSHHHSLLDGWSAFRVFGDAFKIYEGLIGGRDARLAATRPYRDYIGWLQRQDLAAAGRFWRERLRGFTHPSPLTSEQRVRAVPEAEAGSPEPQSNSEYISLTAETTEALKSLARQHRLTLNTIMQGAWALLLSRYSGEPDVVFGAVVSGRPPELEGVEEMVGLFINLLPVRVRVEEGAGLVGWLKGLQAGQVEMRGYEYSPLVDVQGWSDVPRGQPLFETMMVFENYPISAAEQGREGSLKITKVRSIEKTNYPLTFAVVPASGLVLQLSYDPVLFTPVRVSLMLRHLAHLLDAFASSHPDSRLRDLHLLSPDERRLILSASNDPDDQNDPDAPPDAPLHRLFERQARLTPDRAAVVDRGRLLTYRQLDARADALARLLHERGAGPESLVGLMLGRRAELVVAALAILKAGCAYVPLDPKYPAERVAFMLGDADVALLVTERRWLGLAGGYAERAVCLDADPEAVEAMSAEALGDVVASGDVEIPGGGPADRMESLAYVIYTSGSTGHPKGVAITHRSASALLRWASALYSDHELAGVLFSTSVCFDLSVFELFAPLTRGGAVILADDALELPGLPESGLVTLVNTVPSAMAELVRSGPLPDSVRVVNLAGEPLADALAQRVYGAGAGVRRVLNLYGPTEDTTYTTYSEVARGGGGAVNIGRAVTGTRVYLLDGRMEAVPAGVKAEIYIGGEGLARGYLGRAGLTAERFVPDPHGGVGGGRLYRTGDIARHLPDRQIEYLGRADHQVKVRGFRIELGEIETALLGHEALRDAVVIVREDAVRGKELVAYVVADSEPAPGASELRQRLSEKLPDYMIPQTFVYLERLPLTANGKVDRRALPDPGETRAVGGNLYVAARTATEQAIVDVWQEVLGVERVGVHDNFFDLGGHSLLATQVVSRLRHAYGVEVELRRLFERPTVAGLSDAVSEAGRGAQGIVVPPPIGRIPRGQSLPLSFAQQRLWFLDQLQPGSAAYNIPSATRLTGRLNVAALEQSLREIIKRHEVLRTNFASVDGEPALVIAEETAFGLSTVDFSGLTDAERERDVRLLCRDEARRPFELSAEPLLRATLVKVAEAEHVLLLVTHHIVTDGWSQGIMTRELAVLYDAFCDDRPSPLQDLPAQYADYAWWQRRWLRGEALDKQLSYWRGQLAGAPPALQLPTDRPHPSAPDSKGASRSAWLDEGLTQSLNSLGRRQGVTTFMWLLAAFQALLYRYTGQDDIAVGTPIAGRTREELEPLIGFFVNTLVMRTDLSADPSFRQLLARVKEVCLGAYAHQDVPFEKLVEELQPERDLGRTPLFQVMFVLQNMPQEALKLPGLSLAPVPVENDTTKFDLTLSAVEAGGRLFCSLNYKTALFDAPTIERMLGHFRTLLEGVVASPDQPLSTLPILTAAGKERLLFDRNRTERVYPAEASLHRLFEAQVERTPGAIALIFEGQTLSYGELNRRANQLAHHLRRHGVGPEIPVGIFMERSVEMAIAVMAILKAGGAYLPLDPSNPRERLSLILDDAAVPLLLTQRRWVASLPGTRASVMCIGDDADALPAESEENPRAHADAQNPAYIIYTSGSTGRPKGVVIPHAGICNHMFWMAERFPLTAADRVLQKTPFSFDASVWEFFAPWLAGATLVMAQPGGHQDGPYLVRVVIEQQIGVLQVVPALLRMLVETDGLEQCRSLRRLFSGGEALPSDLVERLRERLPQVEIYNLYGPTEAAIDTSYWHCESPGGEEFEPIGRPLPNARLYVADAHLQPVPEGVGGELLIGGAGLARGYLHDPAKTAEKFIPDPFGREAGARLYRSGDVVRYLPGGQLRFLGRNDHQVKIRGFRIEPGEIEAALRCHPAVREAVVVARADGEGDKRLVAYVAAGGQTGSAPTGGELQDFLHERLPSYMIPSAVVSLDALPLSSHGKVNVQALPTPDLTLTERGGNFLAPRDMTELRLMRVWEDILGVPTLGVTDNFFRLGGHSLLAVRMIAQARKRFGYRIPLAALFEEATVMHLAKAAREQAVSTREPSLIPIRPSGNRPPLFFVHPVGGRVFCYTALARHLDPGQPFYGFQSQVAEDGRPALTGIEAMAAHYLGELRGVQPSGPYFLGGWSMGGVIAFEMARQLEAQGQEVRLLALVDSVIPSFAAPPAGEAAGAAGATPGGDFAREEESLLLNSFAQDLGLPPEQLAMTPAHLSSVEPGQQLTRVLEQARRAGVVPADIDLSVVERLYELFMSNHRALRSYAPKPYAGTALLIKAEGRANNYDLGPASGWDKLIGDLELRRIPGAHYTIVREPYVKALAELLREHCRELERQTAGVGHAR